MKCEQDRYCGHPVCKILLPEISVRHDSSVAPFVPPIPSMIHKAGPQLSHQPFLSLDLSRLPPQNDSFTAIINCLGDQLWYQVVSSDKSAFISPLSIAIALFMVYRGTMGAVGQEMTTLFRLPATGFIATDASADNVIKDKLALLCAPSPQSLCMANGLFTNSLAFDAAHAARMKDVFNAECTRANAQQVNAWVSQTQWGK